uniref:Uncharacterized protein n=1 Tax=Anguilla anguilla TaxID=7936 RepID=A0A0E9R3X2_ANGAN
MNPYIINESATNSNKNCKNLNKETEKEWIQHSPSDRNHKEQTKRKGGCVNNFF